MAERISPSPRRHLHRTLEGLDGKWVALRGDEVVLANESPYELAAELRRRGIRDVSIIRAPGTDEPEMVAFG